MNIVLAVDSFKGSCSAIEVAEHLEEGILRVLPQAQVQKIPVADGGEGTVQALLYAVGGTLRQKTVTGPMGSPVAAEYGVLDNGVAVIEMASASGLPLVPAGERNPLVSTTYGTGELIRQVLDEGYHKLVIGIGGSATNDAGVGMAQALGASFLDGQGQELPFGGGALDRLAQVDLTNMDPRLKDCQITVACDVSNPLCGPTGASRIYGPQKGATEEMIQQLDQNLRHFADVVEPALGLSFREIPGAGAAGGLGAALLAFCGATIKSGIDTVLDAVQLEQRVAQADLVITGEGRIDGQSVFGKVPVGVATRSKKVKPLPVIAVVGGIGPGAEATYDYGIDAILSTVNGPMSLEQAMEQAPSLLAQAGERVIRLIRCGAALG